MDKYRLLNEIARKHSAVLLPNMSVSTLLAAFEIQKSLPIYNYERTYQFDAIWTESVLPLAKAEAKRMSRSIMCDCDLVVELARRIYACRSNEWLEPSQIIFNNIRFWQVFRETEDLTERDEYMAFDFLLEHVRQHREIFSGISFRNNNIAGSKESIVQSIFTAMEEKHDGDIPAYRLNAMKSVIQNVITRMMEFMITNRDGVTFGDSRDYDYVSACLDAMNVGPQHHEVCKQILLGYSEQPDWMDIIDAMMDERFYHNPYENEEVSVESLDGIGMEGLFSVVKKFFSGPKFEKTLKKDKPKYWRDSKPFIEKLIAAMIKEVKASESDNYVIAPGKAVGLFPTNNGEIDLKMLREYMGDLQALYKDYGNFGSYVAREVVKFSKQTGITDEQIVKFRNDIVTKGIKVLGLKESNWPKGVVVPKSKEPVRFPRHAGEMTNPPLVHAWEGGARPGINPWYAKGQTHSPVTVSYNKKEMLEFLELFAAICKAAVIDPTGWLPVENEMANQVGFEFYIDEAPSEEEFEDDKVMSEKFRSWDEMMDFISMFDPSGDTLYDGWWVYPEISMVEGLLPAIAKTVDKGV